MRLPGADVPDAVHGLTADVAVRVGQQTLRERADLASVFSQHPEGLDAPGGRSGGVRHDRRERGLERLAFITPVGERLPGEMGVGGDP